MVDSFAGSDVFHVSQTVILPGSYTLIYQHLSPSSCADPENLPMTPWMFLIILICEINEFEFLQGGLSIHRTLHPPLDPRMVLYRKHFSLRVP